MDKPAFPKFIYQVWFQGCQNVIKKQYNENIKNWKMMNPDWDYLCLSDENLRKGCEKYSSRCARAYNKTKTMHVKIDMGKLVYLFLGGGIMVDMDMYILRGLSSSSKLNDLIKYYEDTGKSAVGLSQNNVNELESFVYNGVSTTYGNAVMIATPRNPFIGEWIEIIISNIEKLNDDVSDFEAIKYTTSPSNFNNFLDNKSTAYAYKDLVKFFYFDHTIFEPCVYNGPCDVTDDTIALHQFELTWVPDRWKWLLKSYYNVKSYFAWIITLILILIILRLYYKRR